LVLYAVADSHEPGAMGVLRAQRGAGGLCFRARVRVQAGVIAEPALYTSLPWGEAETVAYVIVSAGGRRRWRSRRARGAASDPLIERELARDKRRLLRDGVSTVAQGDIREPILPDVASWQPWKIDLSRCRSEVKLRGDHELRPKPAA